MKQQTKDGRSSFVQKKVKTRTKKEKVLNRSNEWIACVKRDERQEGEKDTYFNITQLNKKNNEGIRKAARHSSSPNINQHVNFLWWTEIKLSYNLKRRVSVFCHSLAFTPKSGLSFFLFVRCRERESWCYGLLPSIGTSTITTIRKPNKKSRHQYPPMTKLTYFQYIWSPSIPPRMYLQAVYQ